jgi:hypothetical protein
VLDTVRELERMATATVLDVGSDGLLAPEAFRRGAAPRHRAFGDVRQ